jgi:hypothetical protein
MENTNKHLTAIAAGNLVNLVVTLVLTALVAKVALNDEPTQVQAPVKVDVQPTQFEYMVDSIPDLEWGSKAQELGKEGWELVFARRARDSADSFLYECIFQRQVR